MKSSKQSNKPMLIYGNCFFLCFTGMLPVAKYGVWDSTDTDVGLRLFQLEKL